MIDWVKNYYDQQKKNLFQLMNIYVNSIITKISSKFAGNIIKVIYFIYTSIIWDNILGFWILVITLVVDYFIVLLTNFRCLPYWTFFILEWYLIFTILNKKKIFECSEQEVQAFTQKCVEFFFGDPKNPKNPPPPSAPPPAPKSAWEKFQRSEYYQAAVVVASLSAATLVFQLVSGYIVSLLVLAAVLFGPTFYFNREFWEGVLEDVVAVFVKKKGKEAEGEKGKETEVDVKKTGETEISGNSSNASLDSSSSITSSTIKKQTE